MPGAGGEHARPLLPDPPRTPVGGVAVAALLLVVTVAALLRFWRLGAWPVFHDEGIYSWVVHVMTRLPWAQAFRLPADTATKPPLVFLLQLGLDRIVGDPVLAGRLLSAAAGVLTTGLCFVLGRRLGGTATGLAAALLYAVHPQAVLHERMVLQDGPLTAATLGAALVTTVAVERRSWRLALAAALLGALAIQVKVSALAIVVFPVALVLLSRRDRRRWAAALVCAAGPVLSYGLLMGGPLAPGLSTQVRDRLAPLSSVGANLGSLLDALRAYFGLGFVMVLIAGVLVGARAWPRFLVALLALGSAWVVPWIVVSNFFPSRYFLPAVPLLCTLCAAGATGIARARAAARLAAPLLAVLALAVPGYRSLALVADHRTAVMSKLDDQQYRSEWPSGYGFAEAGQALAKALEPGAAVVCLVGQEHRIGLGFHRPPLSSIPQLGFLDSFDRVPWDRPGVLFVVAMNRTGWPADVRDPRCSVVASFPRPHSDQRVWVLRLAPAGTRHPAAGASG